MPHCVCVVSLVCCGASPQLTRFPNTHRRAYLRLSASPEAYFTLKSNAATSHAQLCISHYIAGVGDRHLSNFMIDLDTGKMVGIDFGHAFGSATQVVESVETVFPGNIALLNSDKF